MAAPISAKSASWRAVAPMLAPRSSTMQWPATVGHWPGDGGPLDAGHGAEHQLGHGHQRAGVAGRDGEVGLALLHGLERQPHAGAAPATHGLARLVLHLDDGVGVDDARALGERRMRQQDAARCAPRRRTAGRSRSGWRSSARAAPGTTTAGPSVSAHRVERYGARRCHDPPFSFSCATLYQTGWPGSVLNEGDARLEPARAVQLARNTRVRSFRSKPTDSIRSNPALRSP